MYTCPRPLISFCPSTIWDISTQVRANMLIPLIHYLLQQTRFQAMSDGIAGRIDEMGSQIDDLDKSITLVNLRMQWTYWYVAAEPYITVQCCGCFRMLTLTNISNHVSVFADCVSLILWLSLIDWRAADRSYWHGFSWQPAQGYRSADEYWRYIAHNLWEWLSPLWVLIRVFVVLYHHGQDGPLYFLQPYGRMYPNIIAEVESARSVWN